MKSGLMVQRRNVINSPGMKRVTFTKTANSQESTTKNAVINEGLACIIRAAGIKATGLRKKRRYQVTIDIDEKNNQSLENQ